MAASLGIKNTLPQPIKRMIFDPETANSLDKTATSSQNPGPQNILEALITGAAGDTGQMLIQS